MQPLACTTRRVIVLALALVPLTDALQFLAIDRNLDFRDTGIDMAGTLLGVMIMTL